MGLHLPTLIETRKINKKTKHLLATIKCFKCKVKGHYLHSCPKEQSDTQMLLDGQEVKNCLDKDDFTFFTMAVLCNQWNSSVNKIWILLNNQSTVDVFCNSKLLKTSENLRLLCRYTALLVLCTPTSLVTCQDMAWYGFTKCKILSLANVKNKHKITYNSSNANQLWIISQMSPLTSLNNPAVGSITWTLRKNLSH